MNTAKVMNNARQNKMARQKNDARVMIREGEDNRSDGSCGTAAHTHRAVRSPKSDFEVFSVELFDIRIGCVDSPNE